MIVVTLSTFENGVLKECKANGHAGFAKKGKDIVCAAVTILLKTSMELIEKMEDVTISTENISRGTLAFRVETKKASPETDCKLKCIADFIRTGLRSVSAEYPENVQLREE